MSTRDADYTKTGNGLLTKIGNWLSMVPIIGGIGGVFIVADGVLSGIGWLLRGKPLSALSSVGESVVAGTVNAATASNPIWYMANLASGLTTGRSLGTHARKFTEEATSFVTKPLGLQPTVLRSYYAGIGNGPGVAAPAQPGRYATQIANERGRNAQEMYDAYRRNENGVAVAQAGGEASRA